LSSLQSTFGRPPGSIETANPGGAQWERPPPKCSREPLPAARP